MIKQFTSTITSFLLKENIIVDEEKEIYQFGTERILKNLIVIFVVSIIATVFDVWIATIFTSVGFVIIRKYAGGFHADTQRQCNLLTIFLYGLNMLLIFYLKDSIFSYAFGIICLIALFFVFAFAPVDHMNFVFSKEMRVRAKKKSRVCIVIIVIISSGLVYISNDINVISMSAMMGALTASFSIFIGYIKRRRERG